MPNSHETSPEMPDNVEQLEAHMTPKQLLEKREREKAMLDKVSSTAADMLAPIVRSVSEMGWVKKIDKEVREMTSEEIEQMFVEGNLETLKNLVPTVPGMPDIKNPKETLIKVLLLTGAIGDRSFEPILARAGEKNWVQSSLLLILKVWGKVDPEVKVADEFISKYLSVEGFALNVCKKIRQRNAMIGAPAAPEALTQQPVVAEVIHEREEMSEAVGTPPADHIHDEDEHTAAAA